MKGELDLHVSNLPLFPFIDVMKIANEYNYQFGYKLFPGKEISIIRVDSKLSDVSELIIPDKIDDLTVTRINPEHHKLINGFTVKTLTLPNTIKTIGADSFIGLSIDKLELPTSLNLLGMYAFYGCSELGEVFFNSPDLETLESFTFGQCELLSYINLPKNLKCIHSNCFYHCYKLKHIVIPPKVIRIEKDAFKGVKLNSVVFEGPVPKYISTSSFPGNSKTAYVNKEYLKSYRNSEIIRARFINILPIESLQLEFEIIGSKAKILPRISNNYDNDYCGELEIPDFITFCNRKFKVTKVDQFAFINSKLTKLIIPKNLSLCRVLFDKEIEIVRRD